MASKFLSGLTNAWAEAQMQQVPGFIPRGEGLSVSRLGTWKGKQGCGGRDRQDSLCGYGSCESPEGRCGQFWQLMGYFTREVDFKPFSERVWRLEGRPGSIFRNGGHRERFRSRWGEQESAQDRNSLCAALYLLAAEEMLWGMAFQAVHPGQIDFSAVCIRGIGLDGYVLFHAARDLYKGTNRLSLSELTDPELINDGVFMTLITAFLICRYGACVVEERGNGC